MKKVIMNKTNIFTLLLCCGMFSIILPKKAIAQQPAGSSGSAFGALPERLYARERAWASPDGLAAARRAPTLTWPPHAGKGIRYTVRLSKDSLFRPGHTTQTGFFPWALYVPHEGLEEGAWFWQYGVVEGHAAKGQGEVEWSPVYRFSISAEAADNVSPSIEAFLESTGRPHPRLWLASEELPAFRERNISNPEAAAVIREAGALVGAPLPEETPTRVRDTTGMSELDKKLTIEFMYHGFGKRVGTPVEKLCAAYMLTGRREFAMEGVRRALQLASFDPEGLGTRDDFNSGNVMEAMALAYDRFYKYLSTEQQILLREAIARRARDFYSHMVNRFEAQLCDNHIWQHTLRNFSIAAFAVAHDLPEAAEWLSYIYEVWSGRFPVLGISDGGWHEGNGYFPVHFKTLIYLPVLFGQFTGINYFELPWFRNLPGYMLYSFPPNTPSVSLGDKEESLDRPFRTWTAFVYSLSKELPGTPLRRYAAALTENDPEALSGDDNFILHRLLTFDPEHPAPGLGAAREGEARSEAGEDSANRAQALPRTRVFNDAGLAVSHSDLWHPERNLMTALSSSPFGALGHAHASQNSLTINYKGRKIIGGSGYYTNFSDDHNLLHYRTSRAYSTILADSLGQSISEYGYGYIRRFATGKRLSYFEGDASHAYTGKLSEFWKDRFSRRNIALTRENGVGDAGVRTFRRHVLTLDSNYVIVYDVLEAAGPVRWTWQIHSPLPITGEETPAGRSEFSIPLEGNDKATFTVFASAPATSVVHHEFNYPAVNWKGKEDENGNVAVYEKQWHAGLNSAPARELRYLSVIYIGPEPSSVKAVRQVEKGRWEFGGLTLIAEMDPAKKPYIGLENKDRSLRFVSDTSGDLADDLAGAGAGNLPAVPAGSALILEKEDGEVSRYASEESLPGILRRR